MSFIRSLKTSVIVYIFLQMECLRWRYLMDNQFLKKQRSCRQKFQNLLQECWSERLGQDLTQYCQSFVFHGKSKNVYFCRELCTFIEKYNLSLNFFKFYVKHMASNCSFERHITLHILTMEWLQWQLCFRAYDLPFVDVKKDMNKLSHEVYHFRNNNSVFD